MAIYNTSSDAANTMIRAFFLLKLVRITWVVLSIQAVEKAKKSGEELKKKHLINSVLFVG